MIQLGAVLAIMWLYRRKIATVVSGLGSDRDAQRFAFMIVVGCLPALLAGALLADFIRSVLYESIRVIAVAFIVGGIIMLLVERFRPAPVVVDAERTPVSRALGVGLC